MKNVKYVYIHKKKDLFLVWLKIIKIKYGEYSFVRHIQK